MPKHAELSDAAWLADEYETNKRELTDIARDIGCTAQAVRYALKKFGIKIRPAKKKYPQLYDTDWMSEHYETKQLNSSQIAEIVGCDSTTVSKALAKLGIERRASGESIKLLNDQREDKSVYAELNDVDWLQQKYEVEGLSTKQITELVGARTPNSVRQALIRHGIAVRSVRDGWIRRQRDDGFKIDPSVLTGILLGDGGLAVTADAQESCLVSMLSTLL